MTTSHSSSKITEIDSEDSLWDVFDSFKKDSNIPKKEETEIQNKCSFCSSLKIFLDEGAFVCFDCGTVFDRHIDSSAEWRFYGHEDNKNSDPTRCGLPTNALLPESSLGTVIGSRIGECYEMRMLRKYQMWNSMTYKERTLYNIFDLLTINALNNGIPSSIIDEAKALYKKVSELKISRGANRSGLIASSIYMSCKTNNVPRSAKEIAQIFNLKSTTMTKSCKKFQEFLQMEVETTTASDFIQRFCSKVNLDKEIKDICMHVVKKADEMSIICENTPPSVAAGCIFMVCSICKITMDKKDLASACGVSQVTVSKCYKKLDNYRVYLLPDNIIKKYNVS